MGRRYDNALLGYQPEALNGAKYSSSSGWHLSIAGLLLLDEDALPALPVRPPARRGEQ